MSKSTRYAGHAALAVVLVLGLAAPVDAQTIRNVPADYTTIQAGIDAAQGGDTVLVADGTYTPAASYGLDFKGKAITVQSENGPANCIIDCQNSGRGFWFHYGETASSVVDGFTITQGDPSGVGGGIACQSSPTIMNCVITDNDGGAYGGAMYCSYGDPTVINCTIAGNVATRGGAIALQHSSATIVNCTFTGNTATSHGGALYTWEGSAPIVTNCILWGDSAYLGPEIFLAVTNGSSTLTVSYADVEGGQGAVYNEGGSSTLNWDLSNIDADPLFLDPISGDYHLTTDSLCIDAGDNAAVPAGVTTDLDGEPRIVGAAVDMGAFEFGVMDSDGDGLSDTDEAIYGTDPFDADTDDDGLFDGTEVDMAMGTGCPNPLYADSDGDGLADGVEVSAAYETDPCSTDTDEDGIPDNIDPFPTDPGGTGSYIEDALRNLADSIRELDLSLFTGPNNNANRGRRNALANRANAAANNFAEGDYAGAIDVLENLLRFIDGAEPPPDWMGDSDERDSLYDTVAALIVLLGYM
jgi:hypothetical protein